MTAKTIKKEPIMVRPVCIPFISFLLSRLIANTYRNIDRLTNIILTKKLLLLLSASNTKSAGLAPKNTLRTLAAPIVIGPMAVFFNL